MKIKILHNTDGRDYRIQHLVDTIKLNHQINYIEKIEELSESDDILIFEFSNQLTKYITEKILEFKGKVIFYSVGDGCEIPPEMNIDIFNKISAWISLLKNPELPKDVLDKIILIPRWTIPHIDTNDIRYESKINKIAFVGRTTGTYRLNGKNWRVECLNTIYNNKFLRENFSGWIVDDNIIDSTHQDSEYNNSFKFLRKNYYISEKDWINTLKAHTLSLCIPGHSVLGYRHPQSMACMSTMVGNFDLTLDTHPYMFSDKMVNMSYVIKNDLSDLEKVLEESLLNTEKTKEYAIRAFDFYKNYYEINPNNTYQPHIWKIINENFQKCGIYF